MDALSASPGLRHNLTQPSHVVPMPGVAAISRWAGTTLLVTSVLPMAVFYPTYTPGGLRAAGGFTVAWR
jgi:hypothetical protein